MRLLVSRRFASSHPFPKGSNSDDVRIESVYDAIGQLRSPVMVGPGRHRLRRARARLPVRGLHDRRANRRAGRGAHGLGAGLPTAGEPLNPVYRIDDPLDLGPVFGVGLVLGPKLPDFHDRVARNAVVFPSACQLRYGVACALVQNSAGNRAQQIIRNRQHAFVLAHFAFSYLR